MSGNFTLIVSQNPSLLDRNRSIQRFCFLVIHRQTSAIGIPFHRRGSHDIRPTNVNVFLSSQECFPSSSFSLWQVSFPVTGSNSLLVTHGCIEPFIRDSLGSKNTSDTLLQSHSREKSLNFDHVLSHCIAPRPTTPWADLSNQRVQHAKWFFTKLLCFQTGEI